MGNKKYMEDFIVLLQKNNKNEFESEEEYFFALGQVLMNTFDKLGGADKYRKEFNHLTNPYLPTDICNLKKRILNFLKKAPKLIDFEEGSYFEKVYVLLFLFSNDYTEKYINKVLCEEAFYDGLYSINFIENQELKLQNLNKI